MPEIKEWLNDAPEEIKSDGIFSNFKTPGELAVAYKNATTQLSRKGVILPPDGAKDEEWAPVYETLGRPKESKDYEVPSIPKGITLDPQRIDDFKKLAHDLGMNKKQFQKAFGAQINQVVKDQEAANKAALDARNSSETELRRMFGAKYESTIQGIQKLVTSYGEGTSQEDINEIVKRPGLVKMLSSVLDDMSEASLEKLGHSKGVALTPQEAKEELHAIRTDKDHPLNSAYNNPGGPKQAELDKRMRDLTMMANPGKKEI